MFKNIKKKICKFVLEPDGFSIHTFELSRRLTKHEFDQIKGELYKGCFCARFEEIMACLRRSDHGISERMVSAYLREHDLVAQDGSERISKKVGGVRWVFLNEKFFRRAEV